MKRKLKIKWFDIQEMAFEDGKYRRVYALGAEVKIGPKKERNAVAFHKEPSSEDKAQAAKVLTQWAEKLQADWDKKVKHAKGEQA